MLWFSLLLASTTTSSIPDWERLCRENLSPSCEVLQLAPSRLGERRTARVLPGGAALVLVFHDEDLVRIEAWDLQRGRRFAHRRVSWPGARDLRIDEHGDPVVLVGADLIWRPGSPPIHVQGQVADIDPSGRLALVLDGKTIRLVDTRSGAVLADKPFLKATDARFGQDGQTLVAAHYGAIYDLDFRKVAKATGLRAGPLSSSGLLIQGGRGGEWEILDPNQVDDAFDRTLNHDPNARGAGVGAWSPDGETAWIATDSGLTRWNGEAVTLPAPFHAVPADLQALQGGLLLDGRTLFRFEDLPTDRQEARRLLRRLEGQPERDASPMPAPAEPKLWEGYVGEGRIELPGDPDAWRLEYQYGGGVGVRVGPLPGGGAGADRLPAGTYVLWHHGDDHRLGKLTVELAAGQLLRIERPPTGGGGHTMRGRITDAQGEPVADEGFVIACKERSRKDDLGGARAMGFQLVTTDAEGRYEVSDVGYGPHQVVIRGQKASLDGDLRLR